MPVKIKGRGVGWPDYTMIKVQAVAKIEQPIFVKPVTVARTIGTITVPAGGEKETDSIYVGDVKTFSIYLKGINQPTDIYIYGSPDGENWHPVTSYPGIDTDFTVVSTELGGYFSWLKLKLVNNGTADYTVSITMEGATI